MPKKQTPIIFKKPLVQLIIDKQKRQTRRPVNLDQPIRQGFVREYPYGEDKPRILDHYHLNSFEWIPDSKNPLMAIFCGNKNAWSYRHDFKSPYGGAGDIIWVKETFWRRGSYVPTGGKTKTNKPKTMFLQSPVLFGENNIADYNKQIFPLDGGFVRYSKPTNKPKDRYHTGFHTFPSIHMPKIASRLHLTITSVKVEFLGDISQDDAIAEGMTGNDPKRQFLALWGGIYSGGKYTESKNPLVWVYEFESEMVEPS
ncbi:MAG: hypothetical protein GY928_33640 [Colwellia sp.]|nr:hypothetical protein [Colwellia sp.]